PVHRLERRPVVLAECRDGPKTRPEPPQQPDQLEIAAQLACQSARGADSEQVAINVKLQQIARMVRRLARPAGRGRNHKPELLKKTLFHEPSHGPDPFFWVDVNPL